MLESPIQIVKDQVKKKPVKIVVYGSQSSGKTSLAELAYLLAALACGIAMTLFGSLMVYEGLRLASMLLHVGL